MVRKKRINSKVNPAKKAVEDATLASRLGVKGLPKRYRESFIQSLSKKRSEKKEEERKSVIADARTVDDLSLYLPKVDPKRVSKITRIKGNVPISKLPRNVRKELFLYYESKGVPPKFLKPVKERLGV